MSSPTPPLRSFHGAALPLPTGYAAAAAAYGIRSDVRTAVRDEREALADPVRRVTREIVREELAAAAAAASPLGRMKAAVAEAVALSADSSSRRTLALRAVRGIGAGLGPEDLAALTLETASAVGCLFSEAAVALTTEDAR